MRTSRAQLGFLATIAVVGSLLLLSACGSSGGGGGGSPGPARLSITTSSLPDAIVGQAYNQTLTATGGSPPYSWSLAPNSGLLPPGLSLSSSGLIRGVPEGQGAAVRDDFSVVVRDSASRTASANLSIANVYPLEITTSSLPDGNVGVYYYAWLYASGGHGSTTWSLAPGSEPLPPGVEFSADIVWEGLIKGTPTKPGTFGFTVQLKDSGNPGQTATRRLSLFIDNRLVVSTTSLPLAVVGRPYRRNIVAYGGTPPYTWTITSGNLPAGTSFDPSKGEVSGTPSQEGAYCITVQVTDSSSPTQSATGNVDLTVRPPLAILTPRMYDAVRGQPYVHHLQVGGGIPPFHLRISSGALPPGVQLVTTSAEEYFIISGTPTELGQSQFALEATDSDSPPYVAAGSFSIRVNEPLVINPTSLPVGMVADPYTVTLTVSGGVPPYTWGLYGSTPLPAGLTLDSSTGQISGTPAEVFDGILSIEIRDSAYLPQYAYIHPTLRIVGRLGITTSRLHAARPNVPYRVTLGLFGGTAPYTWSITSGALPTGLSLNPSTGEITGTPTTEETRAFTVQVKDTGPPLQTTTRDLSLTISDSVGRNDTIATATPISNGTFRVSISPYADPASGPANPDTDYYVLTATPGATVTVETLAKRLTPPSPLDSAIEIVDFSGTRFTTCRNEGYTDGLDPDTYDPTPTGYDDVCVNDDIDVGVVQDSKLEFQVPGTPGTPVTFYVRVFDWSGNARPDYVYDLIITGAN